MKTKKEESYVAKTEIYINNVKFLTKANISILEASSLIGFNLSRFCYHESLSIVGTCRICLVEIEKSLRPAASCSLPIISNMRIHIDTPLIKKARESVIETLLINHPLDCPICDQAGECDLQDIATTFGGVYSRTSTIKRVVEDKSCGTLIKTIMTRCIHCTRCVRFITEIAGTNSLGTFNRGMLTEIGGYVPLLFNSELSGNIIDLCPVGALTSKPYAFKSRPWDMKIHEGIDLNDSTGSNTYVHFKDIEIVRILPKRNDEINGSFISDKSRFSYDFNKYNRIKDSIKDIDPNQKPPKYDILNFNERHFTKDEVRRFEAIPPFAANDVGWDNHPNGLIRGYLSHEDGMIKDPITKRDFEKNERLERERIAMSLWWWKQSIMKNMKGTGDKRLIRPKKKPVESNWQLFINQIDQTWRGRSSNKVLIVINDEIDLESIDTGRKLVQIAKNKVKLRSINSSDSKSIVNESYSGNKIDDIKGVKSRFCFLLCCNLKLEASVLNGKLRAKYSSEEITIYNFGHHFIKNLAVEFAVVGTAGLLRFFEGKSEFSKKFISNESPLFFFGETFKKRFYPAQNFAAHIKNIMPTSISFIIESCCNSRGLQFMNVKSLTNRDLLLANAIVFINLDDNFATRSIFELKNQLKHKYICWLNSHNSQNLYQSGVVLPTKSLLETKGTFVNLEGRPQKSFKVSDNTRQKLNVKSTNVILKSVLNDSVESTFLKHVYKYVRRPKTFSKIQNIFHNNKPKGVINAISEISVYPFLPSIEDFYTKGFPSKHSLTMLKCSKERREESKAY